MLNGEALAYGKNLREDLGKQEGQAIIMIDVEELRQFLDVAVVVLSNKQPHINKETPRRPLGTIEPVLCPNCIKPIGVRSINDMRPNYCSICGQKLDWSPTEEY